MISKKIRSLIIAMTVVIVALSAFAAIPVNADNTQSASIDEQYAYEAFNSEWRKLYDDIVSDFEEYVVNADEVEGTVYEQNGFAATGDNAKFIVDGMTYSTSEYDLTYDEILSVIMTVRYCNPQYYFISSYYFPDTALTQISIAIVETYAHKENREEIEELIEEELDDYIKETENLPTDYEKVKKVHDMMVDRIKYAYDENGHPENAEWAHSIVGAVKYGEGTCETYAKWFSYVLNALGIGNYIVTGTSDGQGHAWNIVQMDDRKWYYIDVTWDDMDTSVDGLEYYYGYFAIPSSRFSLSHTNYTENDLGKYYQFKIPTAEDTYEYSAFYREGNVPSFESEDALRQDYYDMWAAAFDRGERTVVVYAPEDSDVAMLDTVLSDLSGMVKALKNMGYGKYLLGSISSSCAPIGEHLFIVTVTVKIPEHDCQGNIKCDENGHYWVCTYCGEVYDSEEHTEKVIPAVSNTCTTDGSTEGKYCSVCNYVIEYPEPIPAAHSLKAVDEKSADCGNAGVKAHHKCTSCGSCFADAQAQSPIDEASTVIPATGNHTGGSADCKHKARCTVCSQEYGAFGEHNFTAMTASDAYIATRADCINRATYYYSCAVCAAKGNITFEHGELAPHESDGLWRYDSQSHWQSCVTCSVKTDEGTHYFDNSKDTECICGFVRDLPPNQGSDNEDTTTTQTPPTTNPITGTKPPVTEPVTGTTSGEPSTEPPTTDKPTTDKPVTDKPTVTTPKDPVITTKPVTEPSTEGGGEKDPITSTDNVGGGEDDPVTDPSDKTTTTTTTTTSLTSGEITTTDKNSGGNSGGDSNKISPLTVVIVIAAALVVSLAVACVGGVIAYVAGVRKKNNK